MLAVPSAGDELASEVAFLFGDLDEIERHRRSLLALARAEAAGAEQEAARERGRLLGEAREEGERRAQSILVERRAQVQESIRAMRAEAEREAERVHERGRQRTQALVDEIVARLLGDLP
jgi:F0F1-type ATP synthase membrane subunit b/b'